MNPGNACRGTGKRGTMTQPTLSLPRQLFAIAALWIGANDLQWLGFPCVFDSWWVEGKVSPISGVTWALGILLGFPAPWMHRPSRFITTHVLSASALVAFVLALGIGSTYEAPIAQVMDPIAGFVLATWSLTGCIALLVTALWPLKPFMFQKVSYATGFTSEMPKNPVLLIEHEGTPPRSYLD